MTTQGPHFRGYCVAILLTLAGCGGSESDEASTGASAPIAVVPGPAAAPAAPATASGPVPAPALQPASVASTLPPLDLSDMRLWNWSGKWHASQWANDMSPIAWRFDRVTRTASGDVLFRLDSGGAPELQAVDGTTAEASGFWEAEVTLPQLRDGLVVAPLWLYDKNSRDEIDFEFAGRKGLDVTMHVNVGGQMRTTSTRLFAGRDMSGERHRFGIRVDQAAGTIDMFLDGARVHRWERSVTPNFVSRPLKPFISMWAANPTNGGFVSWVGAWAGLAPGEALTMTVHGYGFSALQ